MTEADRRPPGFRRTVWLLLMAARRRSIGRQKRQRQLLSYRSGGAAANWSGFRSATVIAFTAFVHIAAGLGVIWAVTSAERLDAERTGRVVVNDDFLTRVRDLERFFPDPRQLDSVLGANYRVEARRISHERGAAVTTVEAKLRDAVRRYGTDGLLREDRTASGLRSLPAGGLPAMWGSIVLLFWSLMLIAQGEGVELDMQQRRHPMWEWLLSHPIVPAAAFFAEMLTPVAGNPLYLSAPVFAGIVYGAAYNPALGILAILLVGIPITLAASCLGKALEIATILRFPLRSRGAILGLLGWFGYTSMLLLLVGSFTMQKLVSGIGYHLDRLTMVPWPWLGWFLGQQANGSFSFPLGVITCWFGAFLTAGVAVGFSVWGARKGLDSNPARSQPAPRVPAHFRGDPLYRKELLWFRRDPSAIVQAILIPLTLAGLQAFNLRGLASLAPSAWYVIAGLAILFGTYFLWVLGPKSLGSEGAALWIALSWPRGLESLLQAKARLWTLLSSAIVGVVLCYAALRFPGNIWQIALVGVGWFFFARSMAAKAVTLVTVPTSSGEWEKIPWGRRWATLLGMLTFAVGVLTRQWPLALTGIVYSTMTAAAMWQNFRARLPYLYDPWSERRPEVPALMHGMIAISLMVESGAVLSGIAMGLAGTNLGLVMRPAIYGVCGLAVSVAFWVFLAARGVRLRDIVHWGVPAAGWAGLFGSLAAGGLGGLLLGFLARGYLALMQHLPFAAELMQRSQEQMARNPELHVSFALVAVAVVPFTEEFLFRGLLFRSLDREWGGWRAVLGSAAFFAIYHPPLAWPMVVLVGAANALLFKRSGWLVPAVVLHMVYNAVVTYTSAPEL